MAKDTTLQIKNWKFSKFEQLVQGHPVAQQIKSSSVWPQEPIYITLLFRTMPWRREWQATPVFLPGKSHGQEDPNGPMSMESQRVRHDGATNTF